MTPDTKNADAVLEHHAGLHDSNNPIKEAGNAMHSQSTDVHNPAELSAWVNELVTAPMPPRVDRPCPVWCSSPDGHPWEAATPDSRVSRFHEKPISPDGDEFATVTLAVEETAPTVANVPRDCVPSASGPSTFGKVAINAEIVDPLDQLTPDQASRLAVWLRQAAISANRYATATFAPVVTR